MVLWAALVPLFVCSPAAATLDFAGRTWAIKDSFGQQVGPGPNRFSADPDDVWVDEQGLHLTIQKSGPFWYSTEVILAESLGYGTYMFQTDSRQDILDANAVFGAFTWDPFGGGTIPNNANREIDFEDSRWGNPADPTNSQAVVQPYFVPGNLDRITLPDLSQDAALTRFFTWSPGQVEFTTLRGHHTPDNFPPQDVIHQYTFNGAVPVPGRETFRFNLWLFNSTAPAGNQPVEVLVNDFQFTPLPEPPPSPDTVLFDFESGSQGWGSFGAITTDSGQVPGGGSVGTGRFHSADFSVPDAGNFGIVSVSPSGQDLSEFTGLSLDALFRDVPGQPSFVGVKELDIIVATGSGASEEEFFAPKVTLSDEYQTFEVAFEDFASTQTSLPPTLADLSDVTIKLVVFNTNGTGHAQLLYDQITGLGAPENADFDSDTDVDLSDLLTLQRGFGVGTTAGEGDANGSGSVDGDDLVAWENQFGEGAVAGSAAVAVPEPCCQLITAAGVLACLVGSRRRGLFTAAPECVSPQEG